MKLVQQARYSLGLGCLKLFDTRWISVRLSGAYTCMYFTVAQLPQESLYAFPVQQELGTSPLLRLNLNVVNASIVQQGLHDGVDVLLTQLHLVRHRIRCE